MFGDGFVRIIRACRDHLPKTALHVLTNGRSFADEGFAHNVARVQHPALSFGIPLYSSLAYEHEYIVQADGAFYQTLNGVYNLYRHGLPVEVRVVVLALNFKRLPDLARYIYRTLPFVGHVAHMGLEPTGYAKANLEEVWVDPWDYQLMLQDAVYYLSNRGVPVSVYNHQICVLPASLWSFGRRSISDWKRVYLPQCSQCDFRNEYGGFFASAMTRHSEHIHPLKSSDGSVSKTSGMTPPFASADTGASEKPSREFERLGWQTQHHTK